MVQGEGEEGRGGRGGGGIEGLSIIDSKVLTHSWIHGSGMGWQAKVGEGPPHPQHEHVHSSAEKMAGVKRSILARRG